MSEDRDELVVAPSARRQLAEQLPESVAFAAYEFIVGPLPENPRRVGKQLRAPLDDRRSARRGTYRVIYRIDEEQHAVTVVGVFPRPDAYRSGYTPRQETVDHRRPGRTDDRICPAAARPVNTPPLVNLRENRKPPCAGVHRAHADPTISAEH